MTRVFLTPDAAKELYRLSAALDLRRAGLGEDFADAVLQAADLIAANPRLAAEVRMAWRNEPARARRIPGFPSFVVLYREVPEGIDIIHVLSAARNWRRTEPGDHG